MSSSSKSRVSSEANIDRRVVERYHIDSKCVLHVSANKYQVRMRDVSIYGMGICAKGSGIEDKLQKKQHISIEWRYGETVNAVVVWSFTGRYGLLLTPPLEHNHPLLVKAKIEEH